MRGSDQLAVRAVPAVVTAAITALLLSCVSVAHAQRGHRHDDVAHPPREKAAPKTSPTSDDFARAYPAGAGVFEADDFHPAETSGLAFGFGAGTQYAGVGLQLGYYYVFPERPFALYGYGGLGTLFRAANEWLIGGAFGLMALFGQHHRWAIDLGFGTVSRLVFEAHGEEVAARPLHGLSISFGHEWMWRSSGSFRVLVGVTRHVDPAPAIEDPWSIALSLGFGVKP